MRQTLAWCLGIGLVGLTAAPASAASAAQDVAYGTGSVLGTLVYAPVKAGFCILGGVASGLTLPFGGPRTAEKVATRACGGTWTITPAALQGREPVRFVGGR
ncbi:MAG TPA: hypothetical protein VEH80_10830 [Candidatus Bathyarchaeia archaeon]|nr:hypothetical protein [Candidatus Bathyarchaeia archaeon]